MVCAVLVLQRTASPDMPAHAGRITMKHRGMGAHDAVSITVLGERKLEASARHHQLIHISQRRPDAVLRVDEPYVIFAAVALQAGLLTVSCGGCTASDQFHIDTVRSSWLWRRCCGRYSHGSPPQGPNGQRGAADGGWRFRRRGRHDSDATSACGGHTQPCCVGSVCMVLEVLAPRPCHNADAAT